MQEYRLLNPTISGNFNNLFTGKTHLEASKQAWKYLSQYISNTVPFFTFTIENTKDGKQYHYVVTENNKNTKKGGAKNQNQVHYEIKELEHKVSKKNENKLKKNNQQKGGKIDPNDDIYEVFNVFKSMRQNKHILPIYHFFYDPFVYNMKSVYIPTFVQPISPYIEIATIKYFP